MWQGSPENRLTYANQRQAEFRAEAAADRAAKRVGASPGTYRVRGLKLQFGALLIVVGRSLCDEDRHQPEPAR